MLDKVRAVRFGVPREIIIVDDGSRDGSREILTNLPDWDDVRVVFHERNSGKGAAIQTALKHARGEFVVIQDADLELDPNDLPRLFEVPNASLISDASKPYELRANKGYVTVYDFIFTNCAASCPVMTGTLRRITAKIPKDAPVRFVSTSVEPARDTPPVLAEYAKRVRNDPRWLFLPGR